MNGDLYDAAYYERGVESGKSCYTTFRWMPEFTIPMAARLCEIGDLPRGGRVLDFGCAKGYLVKAMRLLGRDAKGIDISSYAIGEADTDTRQHLTCGDIAQLPVPWDVWSPSCARPFDLGIAKDVLEHVSYEDLGHILCHLARLCKRIIVVVPLGEEIDPLGRDERLPRGAKKYVIDAYERDVTHVIREPAEWWFERLRMLFTNVRWWHHLDGIKDNWHAVNPKGNAILIADSGQPVDNPSA